jgi:uncharacterized protein (TIGR00725 family)
MEASGKGAVDAGGNTIGIISSSFSDRKANPWMQGVVDALTHTDRLLRLIHEGDGYVVLPGGTGTLLELAAVWEMTNKRIIPQRPVVIVGDLWKEIVRKVSIHVVAEGNVSPSTFLFECNSAVACVETLLKDFKGEK